MRSVLFLAALFLIAISFSSLVGQIDIRGEPTTRLLQMQEKVVLGSSDDNVYAFDITTAKQLWKTSVKKSIDVIDYGNKIVVLSKDGNVSALDSNGKIVWSIDLKNINTTINATNFYGMDKNSKNIFVTSNKAVFKVGENTAEIIYLEDGIYGRPAVDETSIYITAADKIEKLDTSGKILWTKKMSKGRWEADLLLTKKALYFASIDNNLYQLSPATGSIIWKYSTGGWIRSTPLLYNGYLYFGSNDGYFYKLNENGELQWEKYLGTPVATKPARGIVGEKEAIYASGTDGKLYALSVDDGTVLWTTSKSAGILSEPAFYKDRVAFAATDHFFYVHSVKKGCSIESPVEGEKVGYKEVVVKGASFSTTGQHTVFLKINDQDWVQAESKEDGTWVYYIDPQATLKEGMNIINCRVDDVLGTEEGSYTTVTFVRDSSIPLDEFILSIPTNAIFENTPFELYVNSNSDGTPVERFEITVDNEKRTGDKNVSLSLPAGSHTITVHKIGYKDKTITINVQSKEINPLYIGIGAIILLIIIWFGYTRVVKK